jgi:hypothetical protein
MELPRNVQRSEGLDPWQIPGKSLAEVSQMFQFRVTPIGGSCLPVFERRVMFRHSDVRGTPVSGAVCHFRGVAPSTVARGTHTAALTCIQNLVRSLSICGYQVPVSSPSALVGSLAARLAEPAA